MMRVVRTFYCTCGIMTMTEVSTHETDFTCPRCGHNQPIVQSKDPRQSHTADPRQAHTGRKDSKPL